MSATPLDYGAIAKQYGAVSSSQPGVDYGAIAKQFGATDSQPAPIQQPPDQPGFFKRLGQSLGIPTSMDEVHQMQANEENLPLWQKALPHVPGSAPSAGMSIATTALGPIAPVATAYAKTAGQGIKQGAQEAAEAGEQAGSGQVPLGQAAGKAGFGALKAGLSTLPFIGPSIQTAGEDIAQGNYAGGAGGLTGVIGQVAGPKVASKTLPFFLRPAAERMYQSALKPSLAGSAPNPAELVQTGLDAGIPVSPNGAAKLSGLIDNLNQEIQQRIQTGSQAGATVDPQAVAARADQLKARFSNQVNPSADLNAIEASKQEFLKNNPNPLSASDAQAMKQGTYQQLGNRAYGELSTATTEAQKALARGLKEELQTQFPEIKGLNAQEGRLIDLDGAIQHAVNRIGNHQLMGIGTPIVAGAVGGTAGGPAGIAAGFLKAIIDDPVVKSKMAIALGKSQGIPPFLAAARVAAYSNSLGQGNQGR